MLAGAMRRIKKAAPSGYRALRMAYPIVKQSWISLLNLATRSQDMGNVLYTILESAFSIPSKRCVVKIITGAI